MKKVIALFLSIIMLMSTVSVCVLSYAEDEDDDLLTAFDGDESEIESIRVLIKPEYADEYFTPAYFDAELVEAVEYVGESEEDFESETLHAVWLALYLKEPTYENVIALFERALNDNDKIETVSVKFAGAADDMGAPLESLTPEDWFPAFRGSYTPILYGGGCLRIVRNMLCNPYYQVHHDELLQECVKTYESVAETVDRAQFITRYTEEYLASGDFKTLIFAEPENTDVSVAEYNTALCEKYFDSEDILYVGDSVYAAVVGVTYENIDEFKNIPELVFMGDAFFINYGSTICVIGERLSGDVYHEENVNNDPDFLYEDKVTAADARLILRYSAGLEQINMTKEFGFCADMDFDGQINAADARLALRTAARLEREYTLTFNYESCWVDYDFYGEYEDR